MARMEPGRGRRVIALVAIAAVSLSAAITLAAVLRAGPGNLPTQLVRLAATGVLGAFAYAGYGWARGLLAGWLAFIGVTLVLAAGALTSAPFQLALILALAGVYLALALTLLGVHSVHDYIEMRSSERERAARSRSRPPA